MFDFPTVAASVMKQPDAVAFHFLNVDFYWFGVLLALGVLAAITITHLQSLKKGLPADSAIDLCLIALPCGVIGARIAYILMHLSLFTGRNMQIFQIWDGGLSLFGAIIFSIAGLYLYARKKQVCLLKLLDAVSPGLTAALAISSWGHFFNQDFYGSQIINSTLKWFPLCVRLDSGEIHLALFFFLFVWLTLLFTYLLFLARKQLKHFGDISLRFALLFSFAYAILSALRQDGTGTYMIEQLVSACIFVVVLLFLLVRYVCETRLGKIIWPNSEKMQLQKESFPSANTEKTAHASSKDTHFPEEIINRIKVIVSTALNPTQSNSTPSSGNSKTDETTSEDN